MLFFVYILIPESKGDTPESKERDENNRDIASISFIGIWLCLMVGVVATHREKPANQWCSNFFDPIENPEPDTQEGEQRFDAVGV